MASKEIAISKRAKITEAQQYMLLAVLMASVFLGIAISLSIYFSKQIAFNATLIAEKEKAAKSYSDVIKNIGMCKTPKGNIYSKEELDQCNPATVTASQVPGTLRANILQKLAANRALNAVPKDDDSNCINPKTNKGYTYEELNDNYTKASGETNLIEASNLLKTCSALRVIPDALPASKNEEALLASLNKIFIVSGWEPESLSPSSSNNSTNSNGLNPISVSLAIEANSETVTNLLNNIERSVREFNINRASIEWSGNDTLSLRAQAEAYYINPSTLKESSITVTANGEVKEGSIKK